MESSPGSRWRGKSRLRWEDMEEAPVTAATGSLGPVIAKLSALLGSEYKIRWRTRRDVKFIMSKLKPVHCILWNIWEREELDAASKALKMEALDLADDVDDAIVDFILSLERNLSNKRLVQTKIKASPFHDFKKRSSDVSRRCRTKWKKALSSSLSWGKLAIADSGPAKPRAPFLRKDASELVGMAGPRDELIQHLAGEGETTPVGMARPRDELKNAFIYGSAGMGKTTLADLVYEAIGSKFQSQAFVSVTPGGNTRGVLAEIIQQVAANTSVPLVGTEASTLEHLIDIISNFLKDKRYLVIIDDIWSWREWDIIMKSLPMNNLGSRIVGTTRIPVVAKKWRNDFSNKNALHHEMLPRDDGIGWFNKILGNDIAIRQEKWVYKIGENNIATGMVAMKANLVAEGFNYKHPIVNMCGGIPLAVRCMLSVVAQERQKQAHQGIHAKACDVQDEIEKHVKEYGIQNTAGFEDLTESLQLGFDDLPHHMLKTCLLYCSIYTGGHIFQRHDLVRRWISERFVYKEEEAKSYFEELVDRGLILCTSELFGDLVMHPMMRNFLRWKSRQDNLITCSSEITPSDNTCRIRRICLDNSPCRSRDAAADPLSALDWNHIRSIVVFEEGFERIPLKRLEGLRVLDICRIKSLQNHHLMDICGLVRLRHLLGLNGDQIIEIPTEIVRLQCLETFQAIGKGFRRLPGFIGNLKLLKTLDMNSTSITELPKEIWSLQHLKTLDIRRTRIRVLPKEIGEMQQLKTLDISRTSVTQLPKEIGRLQQLRTLDISDTSITVLPKEIRKLQHLEHLLMTRTQVGKIPREIGALKELKSLKLDNSVAALPLEACALVTLPECIRQALRKDTKGNLLSELAREMPSYKKYGGLGGIVVGAKQMHIPMWIREHFNDIALLDISICKLEEEGLKILREMPKLGDLTLRFHVVPREPVVIRSEGFTNLIRLTLDSRVPRVTFQEGAMPSLLWLKFLFQFYAGPPNIHHVGVNHLKRLNYIDFICNEDWYGGDSPCIRPTIDVVSREAQELPCLEDFKVCGRKENICRSSPEIEQKSSSKTCEEEEQVESSSGVSEIQNIQD